MVQKAYDVVVIGSGVGGMCAAALLAKDGYKTLVLEHLPQLGGRCGSVKYRGFTLSTGAVTIPGSIGKVFEEVGATFDITPEKGSHFRVEGKDYEMPSSSGINWLISQIARDEKEAARVTNALRQVRRWKAPSPTISFDDWLMQFTDNQRILNFFRGIIPALVAVNSWELPASAGVRFMDLAREYRVTGIAGKGNSVLWESLADNIRARGGAVLTRSPAKRILVNNGVVEGVVAEIEGKESEVKARVVISNTGPRSTVELVGKDNLERSYVKEVQEVVKPVPVLWIQAAIHDPNFKHPGVLQLTGTRRIQSTVCITKTCPEVAPEGTHLLVSGGAPRSSLPPYDFKKEVDQNIMDLDENFPEFSKHGEILVASWYHGEWPSIRTWVGSELDQKTPIENLYNVGDAVCRPGNAATAGAAETGRIVAEDIKKRVQPAT